MDKRRHLVAVVVACLLLVDSARAQTSTAVDAFNNFTTLVNSIVFFGSLAVSVVLVYVLGALAAAQFVVNLPGAFNGSRNSRHFRDGTFMNGDPHHLLDRLGVLLEAWKKYDVTDVRCRRRLACDFQQITIRRRQMASPKNATEMMSPVPDLGFASRMVGWMRYLLPYYEPELSADGGDDEDACYVRGGDGCHLSVVNRIAKLFWRIPIFDLFDSLDDY